MSNLATSGTPRPRIGGQAVMEGVMMNGDHHYTVAVRKTSGEIHTDIFDHTSLTERGGFYNLPLVRGVIRFVESLIIGVRTLEYSADFYVEEPGTDSSKPASDEPLEEEKNATAKDQHKEEAKENLAMGFTLILAIILAVALFVALPMALSRLLLKYVIPVPYLIGVLEGLFRMIIFLIYLILVSKVKDIRRTFEYHGAEHKTINTFEDGVSLTVENVRQRSRYNRRCGTSFLFIIMLLSMLIFSFIQITSPLPRFLIHLAMIPVIAGISYEILKFSAKSESKIIGALVTPGLWIQRITTREPDDAEIEVAIASVRRLMETEHPEFLEEDETIAGELFS